MFTLEIRTDSAAFQSADCIQLEISEILRKIAGELEESLPSNNTHSIMDIDGNRCGSWKFKDE